LQQIGKYILIAGIILVAVGGIIWLFGNKFTWFGNLPGDIKIKRDNFSFYAPLTSMILLSILISAILWVISKIR
jgi:hypothetical protein